MRAQTKADALKLLVEFFEKNKRAPSRYYNYELWLKLISYTTKGNRCYDAIFSKFVREKYGYGDRQHRVSTKKRDRTIEMENLKAYIATKGRLPRKHGPEHLLRVLHEKATFRGSYLYDKNYHLWYLKLRGNGGVRYGREK